MTKVWVVMGNDYPDAVLTNEAAAEEYCAVMKKKNDENIKARIGGKIYWRSYEFEVQDKVPK